VIFGDSSYDELLTATVELDTASFEAALKMADMATEAFKKSAGSRVKSRSNSDVGQGMIAGAVQGMEVFANRVMVSSLAETPEVSGTLKESHDIEPPRRSGRKIRITMGYGYGDEPSPVDGRRASRYRCTRFATPHTCHQRRTISCLIRCWSIRLSSARVLLRLCASGRNAQLLWSAGLTVPSLSPTWLVSRPVFLRSAAGHRSVAGTR
jgi:hypothetical protein